MQYWREPAYAKHVLYVQSLYFLAKLLDEKFRKELSNLTFINTIKEQQYFHWQYHRYNRQLPTEEEASDEVKGE